MSRATITNHKNQTVTIKGLTLADMRLIANAIEEGSFTAGDRGGSCSEALLRLARIFRVPPSYPGGSYGNVAFSCGTADATSLYCEVY